MNPKLVTQLKETLIVPVGALLSLAIFSLAIGWNLLTALLFWFILLPILINKLPSIISKKNHYLKPSLVGLILFYAFLVFMIYEHYQTDLFQIMLFSFVFNLFLILFVNWIRKENAVSN